MVAWGAPEGGHPQRQDDTEAELAHSLFSLQKLQSVYVGNGVRNNISVQVEMGQIEATVLSMAVQALVAFALVRATGWPSRGAGHVALASALATAATHPHAWLVALWLYDGTGYWPAIAALVAVVATVEAPVIAWAAAMRWPHALMVSLAANTLSTLAGLGLDAIAAAAG